MDMDMEEASPPPIGVRLIDYNERYPRRRRPLDDNIDSGYVSVCVCLSVCLSVSYHVRLVVRIRVSNCL